jgi:subtilisin family serine protease
MQVTSGSPQVKVGLIDGPIANHEDFSHANMVPGGGGMGRAGCQRSDSAACLHGTFVASILFASRDSPVCGISPDCALLLCPIFQEAGFGDHSPPSASPSDLAAAIVECVDWDARILNLSVGISQPSMRQEREIEASLRYAASKNVLVVVAAGNQGTIGSSAITRHPSVISVAACDARGVPLGLSNLASSIGRQGLLAPGTDVSGFDPLGATVLSGGTSIAAPFVTGAIALMWSAAPNASAASVRLAIRSRAVGERASIVPPLLDAWAAYVRLKHANS